jgi:UDP-N-acetylmuramyl pentapeptide phosphotransferase/UDP-N-acetylglucosamine-1-phosphate transferase
VAIMVVYFFGYFEKLYISESVGLFFNGSIGRFVTLFWIVWLINAYNFMDGIDGIAAAQAIATSFGWCVVSFLLNWEITFFISLLLLSCVSGFVLHNFPNAKVFMGDVGSAFLGYSFAVIPLIDRDDKGKTFLLAIFFVFPFLFDTAYTLLRRLRNAEKIWKPHRSHLYQRLVIAGLSHFKVTAIYFILSVFNMLAGVLFFIFDCSFMLFVPLSTTILIVSMVWYFENSSRYLTTENAKK